MTTTKTARKTKRKITFEDLKGLRAEGYIRDSTLDQRDGFGPEMQRRAIENFARIYGLVLGVAWYSDFITGTSTLKRSSFQQALADARIDRFDVLLVYHTSRFARNRADAIRYKDELRKLDKVVVFVSQGIISGNDNDFLNEGINELLDEQYSRNLSVFVADGLRVKHEQGIANGVPPLGYKSEKLDNGKRERKVPDFNGQRGDPKLGGMDALLALLRGYASGGYSYQTLAEYLNTQGYRNREGEPFTKGSVEHVLSNRFYEGKAVYHPGEPDEEVKDGDHQVPAEVQELWLNCQETKRERVRKRLSCAPLQSRIYPFSGVARCVSCQRAYHGKPSRSRNGRLIPELEHHIRRCGVEPIQVPQAAIEREFDLKVLPYLRLDETREKAILACMDTGQRRADELELQRLEATLERLRNLYLWEDIDAAEYQTKRSALQRQQHEVTARMIPHDTPNLDRAAELLNSLPALWKHPGVTDLQRKGLLREVFEGIYVEGKTIRAIQPHPQYVPLFAYQVVKNMTVSPDGSSPLAPILS